MLDFFDTVNKLADDACDWSGDAQYGKLYTELITNGHYPGHYVIERVPGYALLTVITQCNNDESALRKMNSLDKDYSEWLLEESL